MSNLTRLRTQILITNTFMELLKEKPFSAITINHICEKAMIHRSTFYRYYVDKYELFSATINTVAIELFEQTKQGLNLERTFFEEVIDYIDVNRALFFNVTSKNNSRELYDKLIQLGGEALYENATQYNDPLSREIQNSDYPNVLCDFYCSGFFEIIKKWINNEYPYSKEELIYIVNNFLINEPK
ncbi:MULTISPECIES: TetR/AcrR family transcriptional regulator C-terminal domain-containing protein [Bacillus]|mgnify:CR=1 FL=1|uniref:TetR family transcriptional regulator n=5 Tax=Bacillus cereus group TaxID=86661 RepID=A0A9X6GFF9_BACCE|nr:MULTISPECIES: TetR/AcrR family transcriptional regulator C-terminal domain-containing protein [Bacillus]MBR3338381.1 TetR/AcrR family transcriptional regulator C-terminal domain-containing protein [Bacillus sp. (in: firmicutes)]ADH05734.1 TetR family transcriptional regulator [Bacillus thuringiensis BMB171]AOM04231.1 Transcriptional regulator, TetR family [Bacillus cereus]ASI82067.1 Transcriptional regulator, TetR family [Bacillus cereus]ASK13274.1 TetR family transcriptional regulator [Bac